MIHHSIHLDQTPRQRIGIQRTNNHYIFLHWKDSISTDKFKYFEFSINLDHKRYRPIGPTSLVEW